MSKRKLSDRQTARVQQIQQQHLRAAASHTRIAAATSIDKHDVDDANYDTPRAGLLVAFFGVYADVEDEQRKIYRCVLRQNLGVVVAGDQIVWQPHLNLPTGIIVAVKPRRTFLQRPMPSGKSKGVAANIDQLILVLAAHNKLAFDSIDSYLVAAELNQFKVIIVLNKSDLLSLSEQQKLLQQLSIYTDLNYSVILVSAHHGLGLAPLQAALQPHTSIVVGQSGVGKSSLLATLLPTESISVAEATEQATHGMHTTTAARLYHLPSGGKLIDSPGVRNFRLWAIAPQQIAQGFVEFRTYLGHCHFRNCQHVDAQHCALLIAVQAGEIQAGRFASYRRILANLQA